MSARAVKAASPAPGSAIAQLRGFEPPLEFDRGVPPRSPRALVFSFGFQDIPFKAKAERRNGRPVLTLTGDLGPLPFSIQNAAQRRRMLKVLAAAQKGSAMRWDVTPENRIVVTGDIELGMPLTPIAVIAGAATLLADSRPYLALAVAVATEG